MDTSAVPHCVSIQNNQPFGLSKQARWPLTDVFSNSSLLVVHRLQGMKLQFTSHYYLLLFGGEYRNQYSELVCVMETIRSLSPETGIPVQELPAVGWSIHTGDMFQW